MPAQIPVGWELVRLTSVARLESGHTPSRRHPEYWDGDIPWLSLHDSSGLDVAEIHDTAQTVGTLGLEHSSARLLPKGTVVFSRTATVGKSTVMGRDMATSQDFANYVCGSRLHNHYLVHLFRFMGPEWKRLMAGSTHNSIYMPVFQDLQILLPPICEQEAIAEAIGDADILIESLEKLLVKKRQVKQGAMQALLTGKRRLPSFSGAWTHAALGHLGHCHRGVSYDPSRDLSPSDAEGTVRLLRANNVRAARVVFEDVQYVAASRVSDDQHLRQGDILICMASGSRELVGKTGQFRSDDGFRYTFGAFMGCFRPDPTAADPAFVYYLFQTNAYRGHISVVLAGSSINNLTPASVESFSVPVPPDRIEQRRIATVLSDMDAEIDALDTKLTKARQVKQGMMQELLTGRTRLS